MELRTEKLRSLRNDYMIYNQQFDPMKRIILLDWIMDVCNSLGFKRSTYYLSVVLFDLFMTKINNVQVTKLQLIGVCCLILASKSEVKYLFFLSIYIYRK
jgi:hypothetical protein